MSIPPWKASQITAPTLESTASVLTDYEAMLLSIMDAILERYERNPGYPFIDTKLSILTGLDFSELQDPEVDFKGRSAIFGWIQGRGLEALAGHAEWVSTVSFLSPIDKARYHQRLKRMTAAVFDRLEQIRGACAGRLCFLMTPDGRPFDVGPDGKRRYFTPEPGSTGGADLFHAKGVLRAARLLGREDKVDESRSRFRTLINAIEQGRHQSDQISFDPKNPVAPQPGKSGHGWRMISILAFAEFASATGEEEWFAGGARFIRYTLDHYINLGQWPALRPHDFVESIGPEGLPWTEAGRIICDPGHALEFIGLAAKFLLVLREKPVLSSSEEALLHRCRELFPRILLRAFNHGFNRRVGGICKSFDLVAGKPVNSDMPWWSLPETMRAAAGVLLLLGPDDDDRADMLKVIADCSNAFVNNFVNRRCHLMAYQTIDAEGRPIDVIPATPDADPGYHTGLSIIDFLAYISRLSS